MYSRNWTTWSHRSWNLQSARVSNQSQQTSAFKWTNQSGKPVLWKKNSGNFGWKSNEKVRLGSCDRDVQDHLQRWSRLGRTDGTEILAVPFWQTGSLPFFSSVDFTWGRIRQRNKKWQESFLQVGQGRLEIVVPSFLGWSDIMESTPGHRLPRDARENTSKAKAKLLIGWKQEKKHKNNGEHIFPRVAA